jgi:hypothetical protein
MISQSNISDVMNEVSYVLFRRYDESGWHFPTFGASFHSPPTNASAGLPSCRIGKYQRAAISFRPPFAVSSAGINHLEWETW